MSHPGSRHAPKFAPGRPNSLPVLRCRFRHLLFVLAAVCLTGPAGAVPAMAHEHPLVVMLGSAPATLDPFLATDANGVRIAHQLVFETLTRLDDNLEVVPGLVRWKALDAGRVRLILRGDARFSDGAPVEAADVVHTLRTFMEPETGSPYGAALREKIAEVRPEDRLSLLLTLKVPLPHVLGDLILPAVSRRHPGAGSQKPEALIGSGPFRLVSRSPGEIVLERNPHHPGSPGISRVVLKVVRDESTRVLKFRKGDIGLGINVLPLDKLSRFRAAPLKSRYHLLEAPGLSFQYLGFNFDDPVLARPRVRQAIARAIDVQTLITYRQKGHSFRATGLFPPGSPYADPGVKAPPFDLEAAGRLLDQAGLPMKDGRRFELVYKTSTDRSAVIQARVIADNLGKVGIRVSVRSLEWATFYADIKQGNFQLYSLRWIGVSDPGFLYELLHSDKIPPNGRNRGHYANPAMDRMLEELRATGEPAKVRELARAVHRLAAEDLPYLSLWHNNNVAVATRELQGLRLHPSGGFEHLGEARWAAP